MKKSKKNIKLSSFLLPVFLLLALMATGQTSKENNSLNERPKTPVMGWASWNSFRNNINEKKIKTQVDAMVATGMKAAGYHYFNIDDGFFGGRDEDGKLLVHPERFPNGMAEMADYIHSKGLKAGIYSDAGINTCASYWDKDPTGVGVGLYHHDEEDLSLMLDEWGYDFIKIDWCGGDWLGLDEQVRYTQLGKLIRKINPNAVYNICRWEFPGEWAVPIADSWRISADIDNTFESILRIIDLNADLWRYSSPGHVNDMDMLQVGRGMTYEEDKAHFTMWSIMNSPLLAGNDLTKMSEKTLKILTDKEIIALNQDPLVYQARRLEDYGETEVWAKPLTSTSSGKVGVALLNRSEQAKTIRFKLERVSIDSEEGYTVRDLWEKKDYKRDSKDALSFTVPAHGVVALKITGTSLPYNIFQTNQDIKNEEQ